MARADEPEVLATIVASPPRRWLGVLSINLLGGMLLYVAFAQPPAFGWQMFLLAMGAGSFWLGEAMRRSTQRTLELTRAELRDDTGQILARIDDIERVDRGIFAFKPSNGFLVRTRRSGPRAWNPGLWWRMGRRIGVGGVTSAHQAKFMVEILTAMLLERDGEV